jgi:hypothetical protein
MLTTSERSQHVEFFEIDRLRVKRVVAYEGACELNANELNVRVAQTDLQLGRFLCDQYIADCVVASQPVVGTVGAVSTKDNVSTGHQAFVVEADAEPCVAGYYTRCLKYSNWYRGRDHSVVTRFGNAARHGHVDAMQIHLLSVDDADKDADEQKRSSLQFTHGCRGVLRLQIFKIRTYKTSKNKRAKCVLVFFFFKTNATGSKEQAARYCWSRNIVNRLENLLYG